MTMLHGVFIARNPIPCIVPGAVAGRGVCEVLHLVILPRTINNFKLLSDIPNVVMTSAPAS